jgi:hypothetical protein
MMMGQEIFQIFAIEGVWVGMGKKRLIENGEMVEFVTQM